MIEVLFIAILIGLNGFFAMAEFAIVSSSESRLLARASRGDKGALVAIALSKAHGEFLSTIQVGITLIGVLAGAFGGARIADDLAALLAGVPRVGAYAETISIGIVVATITYFSIVLGELVPKRIALSNPEAVASILARPIRFVAMLFSPPVRVLTLSTEGLLRLLGLSGKQVPELVTEDEIRGMIDRGTHSGAISEKEANFIFRVLRAAKRDVSRIMTPRRMIIWVDAPMTLREFLEFNAKQYHSHFPVCQGMVDNVVGVLSVSDVLRATTEDAHWVTRRVLEVAREPLFVPETKEVLGLLEEMRLYEHQMAFAIDERGALAGLVTYKSVVGEIIRPAMMAGALPSQKDGTEVDAFMRVHEANEGLGIALPEGKSYDTVAGLILDRLGSIPEEGTVVETPGVRLRVTQMKGPAIAKVHIQKTPVV